MNNIETLEKLIETRNAATSPKWDIRNIASVYRGKAGRCMCGCAGKHIYASAHREWAGKDRGYAIDDDEVSDRSIKIIFGKLLKLGPPNAMDGGKILYGDDGDRTYTVYFKEVGNAEL